MTEIIKILDHVNQLHPLFSKEKRSPFESRVLRLSNFMMGVACVFFILLALLASMVWLFPEIKPRVAVQATALILYVLCMVPVILSLLLPILSGLPFMASFRKEYGAMLLLDAKNDLKHVETLRIYSQENLLLAQQWKGIQIERTKARLSLFFGSPDKVVLFSVGGLAATVWKELNIGNLENKLTYFDHWIAFPIACGLAALVGIVLGGMAMRNYLTTTLTYHHDLLAMAIASLKTLHEPTPKTMHANACSPVIVP